VKLIKLPDIKDIPEAERTPTVLLLLNICRQQQEQIHLLKEKVQALKDEIAILKGQKPKPKIKPSTLEKQKDDSAEKSALDSNKRPGSHKRSKTKELEIHETIRIAPENLPEGSRLKDYTEYTVQDLIIEAHNTVYQLQRWITPDGQTLCGKLPQQAGDGHFGQTLVSYVLYQHYHARVPQTLIWEGLNEFGIEISTGQINRIITEGKESFHHEKSEILKVGLEVSKHIQVDDTGARHRGKNGYCTQIGNAWFAWFESTSSKSRINFLELLCCGHTEYTLNDYALAYMESQKLPKGPLSELKSFSETIYPDERVWIEQLKELGITTQRHIRIATEGALLGSVIEHGIRSDLVIMSDDAGQFNVLIHILCWIHAERTIQKLVGFSDEQRAALEAKRSEIWDFYADLKAYKQCPTEETKEKLSERFDTIFTEKTCFTSLNKALQRLHKNKSELLLVLERPDIPLHNNESEQAIREYVMRRKISGSTRSDLGRRCRDTFTSLKKTCRKLGVSFWQYLRDRVSGSHTIDMLPEMIRRRAMETHG
jgi:hypothetical protein